MSWLAVEKARELQRKYPDLFHPPVDIEALAEAEGLEWFHWPFLSPVREVKRGKYIGIASGIDDDERRSLIAHALGHHLMHSGNQLSFYHKQQGVFHKDEREADACAAHILIPEEELQKIKQTEPWEIADLFRVTEELARQRVTEFATERDLARWPEWCQP